MFNKKEEEKVMEDSSVFHLKPSYDIPTEGYRIDLPSFGGFIDKSQIIIYVKGQAYHYFVRVGESIFIVIYTDFPPLEYLVKEACFEKNELVLERKSKYNF